MHHQVVDAQNGIIPCAHWRALPVLVSTQQAALWSDPTFNKGGFSFQHFSITHLQRGAKGQAFGMEYSTGGWPSIEDS
jgi:hypothetical protein